MLELSESYNIARQMRDTLKDKIVSEIVILQSPHKFTWFWGDRKSALSKIVEIKCIQEFFALLY